MGAERPGFRYDQSLSERFTTHGEGYTSQYYLRSMAKLESLGAIVRETIKNKWPDVVDADSQSDGCKLVPSINYAKGRCVAVGTVFKDMKNQPTPLDEYTQQFNLQEVEKDDYTDDGDVLYLEDHTQRLMLTGEGLDPHKFVSGLVGFGPPQVIGVRGYLADNKFVVEDYTLPEVPSSLSLHQVKDEDKFIALISGRRRDKTRARTQQNGPRLQKPDATAGLHSQRQVRAC